MAAFAPSGSMPVEPADTAGIASVRAIDAIVRYAAATRVPGPGRSDFHAPERDRVDSIATDTIQKWQPRSAPPQRRPALADLGYLSGIMNKRNAAQEVDPPPRRRESLSDIALLFCILAPSLVFWAAISFALSGNTWACIAALAGLLVGAAAGWAARDLDTHGLPPRD